MSKILMFFMVAVLTLTFVGSHDFASNNGAHDYELTLLETDENIVENSETEDNITLHKHCLVSCFVLPNNNFSSQIRLIKDLGTEDTRYLERVFANRLNRPPRTFV